MMQIALTEQEKGRLKHYLPVFKKYLPSKEGRDDQEHREAQAQFFQEELPSRLDHLAESDVADLVRRLWSLQFWGNKQYVVDDLIRDNGLDRIAEGLRVLLDRRKAPTQRYQQGLGMIKHLGPASITEILCYSDPSDCAIWNRRAREALLALKLERFVSPNKYSLSPEEYERFNALARAIGDELKAEGIDSDLLMVDFYLYEVARAAVEEEEGPGELEPGVGADFDHEEIKELIRTIGSLLGFETQTEARIAHGAQLDVLWRARIGNLGTVTYGFEVHKSGSIDSLLLNLQKASATPTVQRVVAVSDDKQLERISQECEGLPEEFRKALTRWPVNEVLEVGKSLSRAHELIGRLGLAPVL